MPAEPPVSGIRYRFVGHDQAVNDGLMGEARFGEDQPERFFSAWYGPPARDTPDPAPSGLPEALAHWLRQASRWDTPVMRQNRVEAAGELDGDVLIVGVEAQAVWLWGVRPGDHNPPVLERENEPGSSWTETGEALDEFLWHFALVDAVFGTDVGAGANDLSGEDFAALMERWTPVGVRAWRWPGPQQQVWICGNALAWTMGNDLPDAAVSASSRYSVFVAARSSSELSDAVGDWDKWDWDSRNE